jgi:biopolymer transport protein TolR
MGGMLQKSGGGSRRKMRRSHSMMSEINVTPFVDVMLVLLIIFMVAAPLLTTGVSVDLPNSKTKAITEQDNVPVEISVSSKGKIFLGKTEVSIERLTELLRGIALENKDRRVYIRADHKLSYGQVMDVMAATNGAGFSKVALITDQN